MRAGADDLIPPAVFLGFCVTESWVPPGQWWGAPWASHVREVCSASDCLLDNLQAAYAAAQTFARDEPEPGPFLIFEIWRGDV